MLSQNLKDWMVASQEAHDEPKVEVQEGETPKEDFSKSDATEGAADTAEPATAEVPAASEDAPEQKVKDQGHQEIRVSAEDGEATPSQEDATDGPSEKDIGEDKPVTEDDVADVETGEETKSHIEPAEAGESQDTPESDDQVKADPEGAETHKIGGDAPTTENEQPATEAHDAAETPVDSDPEMPAGTPTEDTAQEPHQEDEPEARGPEDNVPMSTPEDTAVEPEEEAPEAPQEDGAEPEAPAVVEETGVAMEDEPEDEYVDETAQMAQVDEDIEHFERMSESLEAYMAIMQRGMDENDGISAETASAIRVGLESLDPMFQEMELVPANEAFGVISSRHTATHISMEGIGDTLKKVGEATKRAIQKLFEILYEMFTKVTGGVARAEKRLKSLVKRMDEVKEGSLDTSINGKDRLSIGTQFMGNDPRGLAAVEDVAEYIFKDYPRVIGGIAQDTAKSIKGVTRGREGPARLEELKAVAEDMADDFKKSVSRHVKKLPGQTDVAPKEVPASMNKLAGLARSHRLPGGFALLHSVDTQRGGGVSLGNVSGSEDINVMMNFNRIYNVTFARLSDDTKGGSVSYRVPSVREMQEIAKRVKSCLDLLGTAESNKAEYKRVRGVLETAAKDVSDTFATPSFVNPMSRTLNNLAKMMTQPSGQFVGYVTATLNAYMAVLDHNLSALEKEFGTRSGKTHDGETRPNAAVPA